MHPFIIVKNPYLTGNFQYMKVMKFGGTSVGKPERMRQVSELITRDQTPTIVVLSALSGTTNSLVDISQALAEGNKEAANEKINLLQNHYRQFVDQLLSQPATREKGHQVVTEHFDFLHIIGKISFSEALNKDILAQGELLSTRLFSLFLEENGIDHVLLPALEFMSIDQYEEPQLLMIRERLTRLIESHADKKLFITQGYICRNARGEVDNLKRGGSDYTASLVAAAVRAEVCEIWTDIDGMHNNDPRIVERTLPVEQLSFDEAAELAYFGAKILHPTCIWPAQQENVPVKLLNTMQPDAVGTVIRQEAGSTGVKAVAAKDGITAIKIKSSRMLLAYGFLRKIFEVFEKYKTSIDMITTSEVAVAVTIDSDKFLKEIVQELQPFGTVEVESGQTIVSIVGNEIGQTEHVLEKLFTSIRIIPVTMVSFGGSPHNISLLIPALHKKEILQALNKGLFGL